MPHWITVSQAAYDFRLSDTHIRNLIREGRVRSQRPTIGNGVLVDRDDLEKIVTQNQARKDDETK